MRPISLNAMPALEAELIYVRQLSEGSAQMID